MARTALEMTREELRAYNPVRRHDWQTGERLARAWEVARAAAALLRERYGATRVVVFGSMTRPHQFTPSSDVDLAAFGIQPEHYLAAWSAVEDLTREFQVDLVDLESCRPSLRRRVDRDGVEV